MARRIALPRHGAELQPRGSGGSHSGGGNQTGVRRDFDIRSGDRTGGEQAFRSQPQAFPELPDLRRDRRKEVDKAEFRTLFHSFRAALHHDPRLRPGLRAAGVIAVIPPRFLVAAVELRIAETFRSGQLPPVQFCAVLLAEALRTGRFSEQPPAALRQKFARLPRRQLVGNPHPLPGNPADPAVPVGTSAVLLDPQREQRLIPFRNIHGSNDLRGAGAVTSRRICGPAIAGNLHGIVFVRVFPDIVALGQPQVRADLEPADPARVEVAVRRAVHAVDHQKFAVPAAPRTTEHRLVQRGTAEQPVNPEEFLPEGVVGEDVQSKRLFARLRQAAARRNLPQHAPVERRRRIFSQPRQQEFGLLIVEQLHSVAPHAPVPGARHRGVVAVTGAETVGSAQILHITDVVAVSAVAEKVVRIQPGGDRVIHENPVGDILVIRGILR